MISLCLISHKQLVFFSFVRFLFGIKSYSIILLGIFVLTASKCSVW